MNDANAADTGSDVVLVDDDQAVHLFVKRMLRKSGMSVRCFDDAEQALSWLRDHRPALLLVDYRMPRFDGVELLQALGPNPAERTLLCTAGRTEDVLEQGPWRDGVELQDKRTLLDRNRFLGIVALEAPGATNPVRTTDPAHGG